MAKHKGHKRIIMTTSTTASKALNSSVSDVVVGDIQDVCAHDDDDGEGEKEEDGRAFTSSPPPPESQSSLPPTHPIPDDLFAKQVVEYLYQKRQTYNNLSLANKELQQQIYQSPHLPWPDNVNLIRSIVGSDGENDSRIAFNTSPVCCASNNETGQNGYLVTCVGTGTEI